MSKEEIQMDWDCITCGEELSSGFHCLTCYEKDRDKKVESYKQELIKKLREKYDRDSDPDYIYGITTAIQLIKQS